MMLGDSSIEIGGGANVVTATANFEYVYVCCHRRSVGCLPSFDELGMVIVELANRLC